MFTVNRQCDEKKQRNDESLTSNLRLSEGLNRVPSRHVARLFFNQMVKSALCWFQTAGECTLPLRCSAPGVTFTPGLSEVQTVQLEQMLGRVGSGRVGLA